jgi:hypothetical protein
MTTSSDQGLGTVVEDGAGHEELDVEVDLDNEGDFLEDQIDDQFEDPSDVELDPDKQETGPKKGEEVN